MSGDARDETEPKFRRCPQCGSVSLYVDRGELVFFRIALDGTVVPRTEPSPRLGRGENVFCASCSWTGTPDELEI